MAALHIAAKYGHIALGAFLLQEGADVNVQQNVSR
jgi:ankyrin repeat protein